MNSFSIPVSPDFWVSSSFNHWPLPCGATPVMESSINDETPFYHESVLLDEVIEQLAPTEGKFFIDGTLGGGGHTEALLQGNAIVKGIDRDAQARAYASKRLEKFGDRFEAVAGRFSEMARLASEKGWPKADGILLDIGVSSWQIDAAERGFSFRNDGPLDMRMGESELTAAEIVNTWSEDELAKIFRDFGEEKSAWRITQWIIAEREKVPFETTLQLADGIENLLGRRGRIHPATKIFQALRMAVNDELGELARFLESAADLLKPGGRLGIITFHSLEDRMVKQQFRDASQAEIDRPEWPAPRPNPDYRYKLLTRKGLAPGGAEVERNARARSSRLRVVERI
ncbi:16S rRNA (cytosine(1402)-N(4))-methyltransferase RsmH [bacterium]|nr:16S rRNA (cytosine(1402)-N(4))-methyltransferase RsmH [Akkermansiaceae bacterium]MDA9337691.1 16S rRNA (cytosine(1402)-N(4))-methyltransferase RsmH [bacterium]MDB4284568.1 16S rRNA (cytosine(1402)-N(4))-methyltransferase RsmH [Akkermansiaceae bacterium]MDB4416793.1 16S rRNA (cytosine(1402)-N(4))-methyltransferase RsmH [bacterium]MDB4418948.1 16S rRNA (cytosine(1402)-N(4))-methyltransferase RsmH [bacterium]